MIHSKRAAFTTLERQNVSSGIWSDSLSGVSMSTEDQISMNSLLSDSVSMHYKDVLSCTANRIAQISVGRPDHLRRTIVETLPWLSELLRTIEMLQRAVQELSSIKKVRYNLIKLREGIWKKLRTQKIEHQLLCLFVNQLWQLDESRVDLLIDVLEEFSATHIFPMGWPKLKPLADRLPRWNLDNSPGSGNFRAAYLSLVGPGASSSPLAQSSLVSKRRNTEMSEMEDRSVGRHVRSVAVNQPYAHTAEKSRSQRREMSYPASDGGVVFPWPMKPTWTSVDNTAQFKNIKASPVAQGNIQSRQIGGRLNVTYLTNEMGRNSCNHSQKDDSCRCTPPQFPMCQPIEPTLVQQGEGEKDAREAYCGDLTINHPEYQHIGIPLDDQGEGEGVAGEDYYGDPTIHFPVHQLIDPIVDQQGEGYGVAGEVYYGDATVHFPLHQPIETTLDQQGEGEKDAREAYCGDLAINLPEYQHIELPLDRQGEGVAGGAYYGDPTIHFPLHQLINPIADQQGEGEGYRTEACSGSSTADPLIPSNSKPSKQCQGTLRSINLERQYC